MTVLTKFSAALAFTCFFGFGVAQAESIIVQSGKRSTVGSFSIYNPDTCSYGAKPSIKFRQPSHGKLTSTWTTLPAFAKNQCKVKEVKGLLITYTPNPGYRGQDSGTYSIGYAKYVDGTGIEFEVTKLEITVK